MSNSPTRIRYIAFIARNDMYMQMGNGLSGGFTDVEADVETVRCVTLFDLATCDPKCTIDSRLLVWRGFEPTWNVTTHDYKRVSFRNGEAIPKTANQRFVIE